MSYDNYDQQGEYDYGQQSGYYQIDQGSYEDDMEYYQNDKDYYQQNPYQQVKQQIKLQPQQLANFQPRHQFPQQPPQLSQQQPQQFTQSPPQQKQIVQPPLQQKQTVQPPSQQQYLQQQFIPQPPAPQQQQQFMESVQQQQQQFMQALPQQQQPQQIKPLPQLPQQPQQQQFIQSQPQQQQPQQIKQLPQPPQQPQQPQQIKQLPQPPQQPQQQQQQFIQSQPQQFPQSKFKQRPPVTVQKKGPSVPVRPKTVFANRQISTQGAGTVARPTPIQKTTVAPPAAAAAAAAPQAKNTAIPASASPVLDKKAMMIIAAVKQAKLYAVAAVTADKNNDYATAVVNYRQAVNILSGEVKKAPEEDRKAFEDKILAYTRRAELIEVMNKRSASRLSKKDEHPQNDTTANSDVFKEEHISSDPYPEKLPENPYQVPYWTMRMFLKSMTTGAYITPRVYVPKAVWFQQNVKIEYCSMKLGACSPILEHFQMLRRCNLTETNAVYAELQSFTDKLNLVQNRFAQSLPYIKKPTVDEKAAKCMRKELEKGASSMTSEKSEDTSNYVHALMSIFKEAQFLEEWHKYFAESKTSPQILNLLVQVGDYFKNVLCAMVLVDLKGLIDKYMKRSLLQLSKSPL